MNNFIQIYTASSDKMIISRSSIQSLSLTTCGMWYPYLHYTKGLIFKVEQAKTAMIMNPELPSLLEQRQVYMDPYPSLEMKMLSP